MDRSDRVPIHIRHGNPQELVSRGRGERLECYEPALAVTWRTAGKRPWGAGRPRDASSGALRPARGRSGLGYSSAWRPGV